jgi:hypothetical protein
MLQHIMDDMAGRTTEEIAAEFNRLFEDALAAHEYADAWDRMAARARMRVEVLNDLRAISIIDLLATPHFEPVEYAEGGSAMKWAKI